MSISNEKFGIIIDDPESKLMICKCSRCPWVWAVDRTSYHLGYKPKQCPNCHSSNWDKAITRVSASEKMKAHWKRNKGEGTD